MNKKKIIVISVIILIFLISIFLIFILTNKSKTDIEPNIGVNQLPKPEISGGSRGELGIDKNINEATIDEYLNREDAVYRDMRMLEDPGHYENIGGDRFLSGYVEGFEVISLPYIIPVSGLPSEVGESYTGTTLFYLDEDGTYIANYKESMEIIERIFPKDKVIFLMCGGGGYSGMTKNFLVSLGWDENKIYNTGGYWYYEGNHSVNVKKEVDGVISYDFENVPYHNIEFDKLTKSSNFVEPKINVTELKLNTSKIEIEEDTSFQLNVIVLPNEATNKTVKWTSSNELVATVTDNGLVKGIKEGTSTITVESIDGNKKVSCLVTVNKKDVSMRIELDDVSKEKEEFELYSIERIMQEFDELVLNPDGTLKEDYFIIQNGEERTNDLYSEERNKMLENIENGKKARLEIINKMIDDKKTFILLISQDICLKTYSVSDGAANILKENDFLYFYVGDSELSEYEISNDFKLDISKLYGNSVTIIKEGEIYANINPNVDSIKSDEEVKKWLSNYIDIK